jgi:hypothetical protein
LVAGWNKALSVIQFPLYLVSVNFVRFGQGSKFQNLHQEMQLKKFISVRGYLSGDILSRLISEFTIAVEDPRACLQIQLAELPVLRRASDVLEYFSNFAS